MIRSLISQLLQQSVHIPKSLDTLFSSCNRGKRQPSLDALMTAMKPMIQDIPRVYIILDALDECSEREDLTEILEQMAAWRLANLHALFTSRKERDLEISLDTFVDRSNRICLESELVDRDIRQYVRQRLSRDKTLSKWSKEPGIRQEIEVALMKGAQGM